MQDGAPLPLVTLQDDSDWDVKINRQSLDELKQNIERTGAKKMAIVSVMGSFRTGKSLLLNLMLRYLRHRSANLESDNGWITSSDSSIKHDGFLCQGGVKTCTKGIWVWSKPFIKTIKGEEVALVLMDTQGAWDGKLSEVQSATVFGLTAVLSSKLIYNITQTISKDKLENLKYFLSLAQSSIQQQLAAIRQSIDENRLNQLKAKVERPFQTLDILVRDWPNYEEDDWSVEQCKSQMKDAFDEHTASTELLEKMFRNGINVFGLPNPGEAVTRASWRGAVQDIGANFVNRADQYIRGVFADDIEPKEILGSALTPLSFPLILETYVKAFQQLSSESAITLVQALERNSTTLAKEKCMRSFKEKMEANLRSQPSGFDDEDFEGVCMAVEESVNQEYENMVVFGGQEQRAAAWNDIRSSCNAIIMDPTHGYKVLNSQRRSLALVRFANPSIVAIVMIALDLASNFVCDWWSTTCKQMSYLLQLCYVTIVLYILVHVYRVYKERGPVVLASSVGQLGTEMARLTYEYDQVGRQLYAHLCGRNAAGGERNNDAVASHHKQN